MNQAINYLCLQWKRCILSLFKTIVILLIIAMMLSGLFVGVSKLLKEKNISLVNVGMVIPEDEETSKYVMDIIGSMDSVKSLCSFEYLSKEEAIDGYNNGSLEAVVVLPSGFYHDVQVGLNPPAMIYLPENAKLISYIFKELLVAGVSYLQTAEAAVYATLDVTAVYGSKIERSQIGNTIALKYVDEIFNRNKMFHSNEISAFKDMSNNIYYAFALVIIILMFSGVIFNRMYGGSNKSVDNMLKIKGINIFTGAIIKIIVMTPIIYMLGILFINLALWINNSYFAKQVDKTNEIYSWMLLIALTMAIYFQIIYGLTQDGRKGIFVLSIINIIGAITSGLIIPGAYLAEWTNKLGTFMPMKYWMAILHLVYFDGGLL